jgi:hypothetical protein
VSGLGDLFGQIEQEAIEGGCEECEAYQTLVEVSPLVYSVIVHHDDWCRCIAPRMVSDDGATQSPN